METNSKDAKKTTPKTESKKTQEKKPKAKAESKKQTKPTEKKKESKFNLKYLGGLLFAKMMKGGATELRAKADR